MFLLSPTKYVTYSTIVKLTLSHLQQTSSKEKGDNFKKIQNNDLHIV